MLEAGAVRHLLVTVQDISPRVELQARLHGERQRSQKEFSMLLKAFETDPTMMRSFVERSEASLLEINDLLRSTSSASSEAQVLKAVGAVSAQAFQSTLNKLANDVAVDVGKRVVNHNSRPPFWVLAMLRVLSSMAS